jgi:dipeptidyl aminopeptidase/acylaminoacyl peptidase
VALGAGIAFGLHGQASDETSRAPQLQTLAQQTTTPLVVYAEFGLESDTLWAANPDDPTQRTSLGSVQHAYGYGIFPSLSPDGERIAYTRLAPDADADSPAELWVLHVEDGKSKRLADRVDLPGSPVWAPRSDAVVVRRSAWDDATGTGTSELLGVDLDGGEQVIVSSADGLYPIEFSPDGASFYYAVLSATGSDLARVDADGGDATVVAHLGDGFSRDWRLSPNGTQLAYLAQAPSGANVAFVAQILDITTKQAQTPLGAEVEQFGPVWERSGALTIGRLDGAAGADAPLRLRADGSARFTQSTLPALPAARQVRGFDVPLSWSPDGGALAVRAFAGSSASDPGPSRVEVIGAEGTRQPLSSLSDVTIAGWLGVAP